jgi:acyl carrier protein
VQPADRIRDFLIEEAHWEGSRADLTDELQLIEERVIDSMLLLRLVAWLESEYAITISDADVVPRNFGSIERISRLLTAKLDAKALQDGG